ncbi:hypothetical protein F4553_006006 [Allocatelliglobosispora scoriae]|uniref:Condensation domain-containing protein n=1 Tax=Allocatelliglobosispora scoriae TaxID=643052 RepID=A0A841C0J4_9ACTN|nr:condensation domain-containing protein [Allocatelliglobosispora scoriae]MBB5872572.1 hypothetical protein [Allocatelliglobosispora scoriae]
MATRPDHHESAREGALVHSASESHSAAETTEREFPLSLHQRRMWYLCTAYEGTASPIVYLANRFTGPLDVVAMGLAVDAVVARHGALRTRFTVTPDGPRQLVAAPAGLPTEFVDVSADDAPLTRANELVAELTGALLDLAGGGPLVRSRLIRIGADDHVWCFAVHHILADGASAAIADGEVAEFYRAAVTGTAPRLPAAPMGYGEFALWQAGGGGGATDDDLRYWRKQLGGVLPLELPTDTPRPAVKSTRTDQVDRPLDLELTTELERFARAERSTLFMVLVTAFAVVIGARSGQDDFCIGAPVAGRTLIEVEESVGLFNNTLALRVDLSGEPSFRVLLGRLRATIIDALGRQNVPFGQIVTELGLPHDPSRTQVFQTICSLHTESGPGTDMHGLRVEPFGVGKPQTIHDLVLDAWRGPTGLAASLRYDTGLFAPATMEALIREYESTLRAALAEPDRRLTR